MPGFIAEWRLSEYRVYRMAIRAIVLKLKDILSFVICVVNYSLIDVRMSQNIDSLVANFFFRVLDYFLIYITQKSDGLKQGECDSFLSRYSMLVDCTQYTRTNLVNRVII